MPFDELDDDDERDEVDRYLEESRAADPAEPAEAAPSMLDNNDDDERETLSEVDRAIDSFAREDATRTPAVDRDVIQFSEPISIAARTEAEQAPARDEARGIIESSGADRTVDQLSRLHPESAPELPQASAVLAEARGEAPPSPPRAAETAESDEGPAPIELEEMRIAPRAPEETGPEDRALDSLAGVEPESIAAAPAPGFRMPPVDIAMLAGETSDEAVAEAPGAAPTADEETGAEDAAIATLAGREAPARALGAPAKPLAAAAAPEGPMIPTEGDLEGARMRDMFLRRPLRAIGGLFGGLAGRRPQFGPTEEQQLLERRNRMLGEKRQARTEEEAVRQRSLQEQRAAREEEREGRQLSLREQQAEQEARMAEARLGLIGEQTETQRATRERTEAERAARGRADSPASRAAQTQMEQAIATLRATNNTGLADELTRLYPAARLASMSADELAGPLSELPNVALRDVRRRGTGVGGGAPGASVPQNLWGTDDDPLVREAIALHMPEGTVRLMAAQGGGRSSPRQQLMNQVTRAGQRTGRAEAGTSIPGYTRDPSRALSARESQGVMQLHTADREFESAIRNLERELPQLSLTERAAGIAGQGGERYQTIQHSLDVLRTQFRMINNAGNSLGAQEMAEHSFPDLTSASSASAILANARAARGVKHAYVEAVLEANGYTPTTGGGHGGEETTEGPESAPNGTQSSGGARSWRIYPAGGSPDDGITITDEARARRYGDSGRYTVEEVR